MKGKFIYGPISLCSYCSSSKVPKANYKVNKSRKGKVINKNGNPLKLLKYSADQLSEGG